MSCITHHICECQAAKVAELEEKLRVGIEALEFYANGGNFNTDLWKHPELGYFTGLKARQALEKLKEEK